MSGLREGLARLADSLPAQMIDMDDEFAVRDALAAILAESPWPLIDATTPRDGTEVLLGWWSAGVWIVRAASWDDGAAGGEPGWWSYSTSVGQDPIEHATHWFPSDVPPPEQP